MVLFLWIKVASIIQLYDMLFTFLFTKHTWSNPLFCKYWVEIVQVISLKRVGVWAQVHPLLSKPRKLPDFQASKESKRHQSTTGLSVSFILFIFQNFIKSLFSWVRARFGLKWTFIHQAFAPVGCPVCILQPFWSFYCSHSFLSSAVHFSPLFYILDSHLLSSFFTFCSPFSSSFVAIFWPVLSAFFIIICSLLSSICSPLFPLVSSLLWLSFCPLFTPLPPLLPYLFHSSFLSSFG